MKYYSLDFLEGSWTTSIVDTRAAVSTRVVLYDSETKQLQMQPHDWFQMSILVEPHIAPRDLDAILLESHERLLRVHQHMWLEERLPADRDGAAKLSRLRALQALDS